MDEPQNSGQLPANPDEQDLTVAQQLAKQHTLHGMMGRAFERLGGEEMLVEWGEDNPGEFIKMLMKLAPPAIPKGQTGGIHLHVHNDLQPGALDEATGVTIDQTD